MLKTEALIVLIIQLSSEFSYISRNRSSFTHRENVFDAIPRNCITTSFHFSIQRLTSLGQQFFNRHFFGVRIICGTAVDNVVMSLPRNYSVSFHAARFGDENIPNIF